MTRLSTVDGGFLLTESHHSPKHVGGLAILELPKGKGPAWLRRLLAEMKEVAPGFPFDQKLKPGTVLPPELQPDEHFDIDFHVRHTVLPSPGTDEQLMELVARLHMNLLDRDRPLWEFHLIEGLKGRRFAMFTKIHHTIADGLTFGRWFAESCSPMPEDLSTPPIWARDETPAGEDEEPSLLQLLAAGVKMFGGSVKTIAGMSALGAKLIQRRLFERDGNVALPLDAPRTALNVTTGAARAFSFTEYSLEEFHAVAQSQDVSINDLIMTITDLAVNRYFDEHGTPVDEPLIAYMPVNLRPSGSAEDGNLISLLQVRLASTHEDPLESLQQVKASSSTAREVYSSVSRPVVQYYTLIVALLYQAEEYLKLEKWLPPAINLVISNVPGPRERLYYGGAKVSAVYPVSALPPLTALNVTANSYAGTLYFGLVAGRSAIPDLGKLTHYIDEAYDEFKALTGA